LSRKVFRELLSIEEAKARLTEHFTPKPSGVEVLPLNRALGRVLSQDIEARTDVPPFDRASMDGYAVLAENTFGAEEDKPVDLTVVGKVGAGERPDIEVESGTAVEISTGAPIPKGANAVVMVEYTWMRNDSLRIYRPVAPGENVASAGSDIMAGELILRKATVMTSRETAVAAALGITEVQVFKKPVVAVASTGNEIVPPGARLEYGQIYDINTQSICDSVRECSGEPILLGIAKDREKDIKEKITAGLSTADMVVISGGTSAGVGDLLYRIINDLGSPGILVHGVAVRPGKPTIIAVVNGKPLFGLPGYPTSALMIFDVFVAPIVRTMAGLSPEIERKIVEAKLAQKVFSSGGRHEYVPVNLVRTETGEYSTYPVAGDSGAITTVAEADGFIEIPQDRAFLEESEKVEVHLFSPEMKPADLMIIGSHCIGVDLILDLARRRRPGFNAKVMNVGSSGGLAALRRGEADIAGTHLLDEESGAYNVPFLERHGLSGKALLVRGYVRKQGLMVAKGNPKKITGFEDLLRPDLTSINRNPGSGTRVLLDMNLRKLCQDRGVKLEDLTPAMKGYRVEAKSHTAVAVAVLMGKADVGLGIKTVADQYGLDFIPVADEMYDFAVQKQRLNREPVQLFLQTLRSDQFGEELRKRGWGLITTRETGAVIHG